MCGCVCAYEACCNDSDTLIEHVGKTLGSQTLGVPANPRSRPNKEKLFSDPDLKNENIFEIKHSEKSRHYKFEGANPCSRLSLCQTRLYNSVSFVKKQISTPAAQSSVTVVSKQLPGTFAASCAARGQLQLGVGSNTFDVEISDSLHRFSQRNIKRPCRCSCASAAWHSHVPHFATHLVHQACRSIHMFQMFIRPLDLLKLTRITLCCLLWSLLPAMDQSKKITRSRSHSKFLDTSCVLSVIDIFPIVSPGKHPATLPCRPKCPLKQFSRPEKSNSNHVNN